MERRAIEGGQVVGRPAADPSEFRAHRRRVQLWRLHTRDRQGQSGQVHRFAGQQRLECVDER